MTEWEATARLLRRTGFGTTGSRVDAVLRTGRDAHVRAVLAADPLRDPGALRTPLPSFPHVDPVGRAAGAEARKAAQKVRREQAVALATWWVQRMAAVEEPFGEKLTLGWHAHFATSVRKVRDAGLMARQNETLRRLGRGDFRVLALAMLTDPAMLRWLDGTKSTAAAPNENLAREFMELFALGHGGGYTETDVREGARALTGWRVSPDGAAHLVPRLHDGGTKTVLGVTGPLDVTGYCDAVLRQPASAPYLATRWWGRLVSGDPPSPAALQRLVSAYGSGRSLGGLLQAALTAPELATAGGTLVLDPVEWLVGAVRALAVPLTTDAAAGKALRVLKGLGQVPFDPPSVGGWPSGAAWLSTAAADLRLTAASRLVRAGDLSPVADQPPAARVEATAHLLGIAGWSARSAAALAPAAGDPPRLVALALSTPEYLTA
ncbi:MAG: DUF1800 domain-containing protein [Nocardioidaceae bacterium]